MGLLSSNVIVYEIPVMQWNVEPNKVIMPVQMHDSDRLLRMLILLQYFFVDSLSCRHLHFYLALPSSMISQRDMCKKDL